jgi:putative intracellular protease/amidase
MKAPRSFNTAVGVLGLPIGFLVSGFRLIIGACPRKGSGRVVPRHRAFAVRQAFERRTAGEGKDRYRLCQRRGGFRLLSRDKHVMPWRVEDELKSIGANYVQAGLWRGFAVRDGNLITGQQNFSGAETAEAVIRALGE